MGRWEPGASGRLRTAALELYVERGFEQTTVADIALRAGLTARTFFRYFADKREVLFNGSAELQTAMVAALEGAPVAASPMEAVAAALDTAADLIGGNHEFSQRRQSVIAANAELRERELIKMSTLAVALAEGLGRRGVTEPSASLAAEAGIVIFRVAFARWVGETGQPGLQEIMHQSLVELRALTAVSG